MSDSDVSSYEDPAEESAVKEDEEIRKIYKPRILGLIVMLIAISLVTAIAHSYAVDVEEGFEFEYKKERHMRRNEDQHLMFLFYSIGAVMGPAGTLAFGTLALTGIIARLVIVTRKRRAFAQPF